MAYPKILQRLFENSGAGPRLRKEILPFGSTPGTACEGNDARLSNARVPQMHKETHQMGGADALTPEDIGAHPADGMASAGKAGIARLSSAVDMDSEDQAATPKAVKVTHELAASAKADAAAAQARADSAHAEAERAASTTSSGRVQLSSALNSDSEALAATPKAVKAAYSEAVKSASLTQAGRVKLNNTVSSTSAAEAATANAVKTAYDKAVEAASEAAQAASTPATHDKLGVVRVGEGIGVDENGVISTEPVTVATTDAPGIVQVGAGLEVTLPAEAVEGAEPVTPGILSLGAHTSENPQDYGKGDFQFFGHVKITDNFEEESAAKDGVAISAKGVKTAWDRIMGVKNETMITASGSWTVPETAAYSITCVGGGGNGGWGGGSGYANVPGPSASRGGGGGGGGGAGRVLQKNVTLTKGDIISATVGGSGGGTTSFGSHLSAAGGGNGGNGQTPSTSNGWVSNGGAAGGSYGSAAGSGAVGGRSHPNICCAYGGSGGHGGTSQDASYGHGGNGGTGQNGHNNSFFGSTNPASGIQGCIRIRLA